MKRIAFLLVQCLLLIITANGCSTFTTRYASNSKMINNPQKVICPQPFDEFAFGLPTFEGLTEQEHIPIPEPWKTRSV